MKLTAQRVAATGFALLALGAVPARYPCAFAETPLASVIRVRGPVDLGRGGAWRPLVPGDPLVAKDFIRTGEQGFATVRHSHGSITELYPLGSLQIADDAAIWVESGRIWTHFLKQLGRTREIRTPAATALVRRTTFAVQVGGGATDIGVLEGQVEVRDAFGRTSWVAGGLSLHGEFRSSGDRGRSPALEVPGQF